MSKQKTGTLEQLGALWGMTPRRVSQLLTEMGVPFTKGKVDTDHATREYINWLRQDEPTKRAKRELISWQVQRLEERAAREDGKFLRPDEVREYIEDAWGILWNAHCASLSHLHSAAATKFGGDDALRIASSAESNVKGELRLARDRLEALGKQKLEDVTCKFRRGIFIQERHIRALGHAVKESPP